MTAVADRDGHYIHAATAQDAADVMLARYRDDDRVDVQAWHDAKGGPAKDTSVCLRASRPVRA